MSSFEAAQQAYQIALEEYQQAYATWVTGTEPKPDDLAGAPAPPADSVSAGFVERRRLVMDDILRDTLFYERDILNRNR